MPWEVSRCSCPRRESEGGAGGRRFVRALGDICSKHLCRRGRGIEDMSIASRVASSLLIPESATKIADRLRRRHTEAEEAKASRAAESRSRAAESRRQVLDGVSTSFPREQPSTTVRAAPSVDPESEELTAAKRRIALLETQLESVTSERDLYSVKADEAQKEKQGLQAQLREMEQSVVVAQREARSLADELQQATLQAEADSQVAAEISDTFKQQLVDALKQNEALSAELQECKDQCITMEVENSALTSRLESMKGEGETKLAAAVEALQSLSNALCTDSNLHIMLEDEGEMMQEAGRMRQQLQEVAVATAAVRHHLAVKLGSTAGITEPDSTTTNSGNNNGTAAPMVPPSEPAAAAHSTDAAAVAIPQSGDRQAPDSVASSAPGSTTSHGLHSAADAAGPQRSPSPYMRQLLVASPIRPPRFVSPEPLRAAQGAQRANSEAAASSQQQPAPSPKHQQPAPSSKHQQQQQQQRAPRTFVPNSYSDVKAGYLMRRQQREARMTALEKEVQQG